MPQHVFSGGNTSNVPEKVPTVKHSLKVPFSTNTPEVIEKVPTIKICFLKSSLHWKFS